METWQKLIQQFITDNDRIRSATVGMLNDLLSILILLRKTKMERMLDIGCGFGGLSATVAAYLGIKEVHGIDIDDKVFTEASKKGVICHKADAALPLPFSNSYFDLITSFGVLEHLVFWDGIIRESFRILKSKGYLLVSVPNLASWVNRLLLLFGKQLRDVEVSKEIFTGGSSFYSTYPFGHIHTVTIKSFIELLEHYGFETIAVRRGRPYTHRLPFIIRVMDATFSLKPTFARRFFLLAKKQ